MIDVKEAKRLEALEKNLVEKFRAAELKEQEERVKTEQQNIVPVIVKDTLKETRTEPITQLLTVSKAKQLERLKHKLNDEFADVRTRELEAVRENEKKYEPITRAIREQNEKEAKDSQKQNRFKQMVRFRPRAVSTPVADRKMSDIDDNDGEGTDSQPNISVKQLMDSKVVNLGTVGAAYLPRASDSRFGIYYDEESEKLKIGSEAITFEYDDIILVSSGKRFKGTEGLWRLLTTKGYIQPGLYTPADREAYKELLLTSNSLYQKNNPSSRHPKSSQGPKWKLLIRKIWDEHIKTTLTDDVFSGSGLKQYNERPPEYKYINNLNELINRLNFIYAEEMAGNNGFHNEKLSVVKFIHDRMEELIQKPNGLKYLVRCLSALPEHVLEGSGLMNDIINKLPFELHAPRNWQWDTYSYCGPGTKLDQRLARGDKGINPLDAACKQHDIWYRDHKNTEDRWEADKVLQNAAWDRVTSADADLNERAVALGTAGTMWLKRKLGMGLGTSGSIYPDGV